MKKYIIIGGGPAGLTAGYELLKNSADAEVAILEKSGVLGGISRTVERNGNRMDIGGHRFFSKSARVNGLWEELLPAQGAPSFDDRLLGRKSKLSPGGPDPEKEDAVSLNRRRVSRIYYSKKFFDYPITLKPQTFINMGFAKTMKAGFGYLKSAIFKKEETSLENFYINRFGKTLYSMFFKGYTKKLWGRDPSEISADWGAQRVKGLSIWAVVKDMFSKLSPKRKGTVETSLIEEFMYPKLGPGQLWETLGARFEKLGGKILRDREVTEIDVSGGRINAVKCANGERFEGDVFISSMPLKDLVAGMGGAVPADKAEIAAGLPYRDFTTVGLLFKKLNLKNETDVKTLGGIIPDCWIYVQDVGVKLGRIQIFNNWSPYLVKDPLNTVWIGLEYFCDEGDDFWNLEESELVDFAVGELRKMDVINPGDEPLDFHVEKVQKAYPAYFDSYRRINELIEYLDSIENLYCVGRNGQHRYNNMDHSMITSFEAVSNILSGKKSKENIWNVNADSEYCEEISDEKA